MRIALALLCLAACFTDKGADLTDTTASADTTSSTSDPTTTSDTLTTTTTSDALATTTTSDVLTTSTTSSETTCDGLPNSNGECETEYLRVFVTVETFAGHLYASARDPHSVCKEEAENNGLPGEYRAWIVGYPLMNSPLDDFELSSLPYRRTDGTLVANSFDAFKLGNLLAPVALTAGGEAPPASNDSCGSTHAWTGTNADGSLAESTCKGFTSESIAQTGAAGDFTAVDKAWSSACDVSCENKLRLYCFQQPN